MSTRKATTRDPEVLAVERAFPGLACYGASVYTDSLEIRVNGTPECLISHGLITQQLVDLIPKCGYRSFSRRKLSMPFAGAIRRKGELLQVHRWWESSEAAAMCKRLAIDMPQPAPAEKGPATAAEWRANELDLLEHALRLSEFSLLRYDKRYRFSPEEAARVSALVARFRADMRAVLNSARIEDSQRLQLRLVKSEARS
jgi:hypothetical protein